MRRKEEVTASIDALDAVVGCVVLLSLVDVSVAPAVLDADAADDVAPPLVVAELCVVSVVATLPAQRVAESAGATKAAL